MAATVYYARCALADNTAKNYESQARSYVVFCLAFGHVPFPVADVALAMYLTFMSLTCKPQSLRVYLSGIRDASLDAGFAWLPIGGRHFVWRTYQGLKNKNGALSKPKLPITLELLRAFVQNHLRMVQVVSGFFSVWWAAALVAFFLMLRKDNVTVKKAESFNGDHNVCRGDMQPIGGTWSDPRGTIQRVVVTLRHSKTNQDGSRVHTVVLHPVLSAQGTPDILCPVEALRVIFQPSFSSGRVDAMSPAFVVPRGGGKPAAPLTHAQFVRQLKACIAMVPGELPGTFMDPAEYSGHSFRRGGATLAFSLTSDHCLIKYQGDWVSMAYLGYRQLEDDFMLTLPALFAAEAASIAGCG